MMDYKEEMIAAGATQIRINEVDGIHHVYDGDEYIGRGESRYMALVTALEHYGVVIEEEDE